MIRHHSVAAKAKNIGHLDILLSTQLCLVSILLQKLSLELEDVLLDVSKIVSEI